MSATLPLARKALAAAITRDTTPTESRRLVAVLDALITWSVARPQQIAFRANGTSDVMSFEHAGSKAVFWSARVTRGAGGRLEIYPPAGLRAEDRASVLQTLNAHSREVLVDGDRLRIGFGALKNAAAQAAVLALMERLLVSAVPPADQPVQPARSSIAG